MNAKIDKNLKGRFHDITRFLKKPKFLKSKKQINLYRSPWHLMIGPSMAGKTTLIANSDLNFILQKKVSPDQTIQKTTTYEWWATRDAVLVDVPGLYFDKSDQATSASYFSFLKLLKKHCYKKYLNGIILVISLDHLIKESKEQEQPFYTHIQRVISDLQKTFNKKLPFYLVINKCDLITGFREFFEAFSRDERWQPWGILFNKKNCAISELFKIEFNQMIKRLNDQLIFRLQHEQHLDKRLLINEFPAQMDQIKKHLLYFIQQVLNILKNDSALKGIFLSSASQKLVTASVEQQKESLSRALMTSEPFEERGFFIHDILEQIIFKDNYLKQKSYFSLSWDFLKFSSYAAVTAVLVVFISSSLLNFKEQIKTVSSIQKAITHYQLFAKNSTNQKNSNYNLNLLDTLQAASNNIHQQNSIEHNILHPFNPTQKLSQQITQDYQNALNKIFLPALLNEITNILQNNSVSPDLQYAALKNYLMLTDPSKYNANSILISMQKIWSAYYSHNEQTKLLIHLNALLQNSLPPITASAQIIDTTRNNLKQLQPANLAFIILLNSAPNNQLLSLNFNQNNSTASVLTFSSNNSSILSMYTGQGFSLIYPNLIKQAAKEALVGNWVIGAIQTRYDQKTFENLVQNTAQQYFANYMNTWAQFLNTIKMVNFTDLSQLNQTLQLLSGTESPVLQLIHLVKNNSPMIILNADNRLRSLINLDNTQNSETGLSFNSVQTSLNKLSDYLNQIISDPNPDKKAFEIAVYRMRNNGQTDPMEEILSTANLYPEPVKGWLYDITTNAWQLILYQAQNYINSLWQKNITPQYQAQLANRFPFNINASDQVSLDSFNYFFAPNGLLDNFFVSYLSPFIDMSQSPWTLKNIDGETLQLPNDTLTNLETMASIQHLYFEQRHQKIFIPFTIQPGSMEDVLESVMISLGSQQLTYKNGENYAPEQLNWPDDVDTNSTKIIFTDQNGKQAILQETGPWALLKLFKNGNLQPVNNNPKQYQVTFDKNGEAVNMILSFEQETNPFSIKLFNDFRFPYELN